MKSLNEYEASIFKKSSAIFKDRKRRRNRLIKTGAPLVACLIICVGIMLSSGGLWNHRPPKSASADSNLTVSGFDDSGVSKENAEIGSITNIESPQGSSSAPIKRIQIHCRPSGKVLVLEEQSRIESVQIWLKEALGSATETQDDAGQYDGSSYEIVVDWSAQNREATRYFIVGNQFINMNTNGWMKISKTSAEQFDLLLDGLS